MPNRSQTFADLKVVRTLLKQPQLDGIRAFRKSMGLWFWAPSLILSFTLCFMVLRMGYAAHYGVFAVGLVMGMSGLGWFGRFYIAGIRMRRMIPSLHEHVPWDSLRFYAGSDQELDRINTLEQFMSGARGPWRAMSVMPMLVALLSILELSLTKDCSP